MKTGFTGETIQRRVLIFPALTPAVAGREIHFLFSPRQVAEIIGEISVQRVPFSPEPVEGIVSWRDQVAPAASLEKCLGLPAEGPPRTQRWILVRAPGGDPAHPMELRCMFRAPRDIHFLALPIPCAPTALETYIPNSRLARAAYEWENKLLVVVHTGRILMGEFQQTDNPG